MLCGKERNTTQLTQLKTITCSYTKQTFLKQLLRKKNTPINTNNTNKQNCYIHTKNLIQIILERSQINPKEEYKQFILHLRSALTSKYYLDHRRDKEQPPIIQLLETICFWFYTKTNIQTYQQNLSKHILVAGGYTTTKGDHYKNSSESECYNSCHKLSMK